jgi:hypothetical protein
LLAEQAPWGRSTIARVGGVDSCQGKMRGSLGGGIRGSERQLGRLTRTRIEPVGAAWRQEHQKGRATSLQALREMRVRRQKEARGLGAWLKFWVKLTSASGAGPSRCMGLARRQALSPRAEVIADGDRLSCWLVSQSSGLEDTRRGSRPRQRSGPAGPSRKLRSLPWAGLASQLRSGNGPAWALGHSALAQGRFMNRCG